MIGTKMYTINYFIRLFTSTTARTLASKGVASVVAPRKGSEAVSYQVLNSFLNGQLTKIVNGTGKFSTFGETPRARLLKALKLRKATRG
jgi:hypothetical protein